MHFRLGPGRRLCSISPSAPGAARRTTLVGTGAQPFPPGQTQPILLQDSTGARRRRHRQFAGRRSSLTLGAPARSAADAAAAIPGAAQSAAGHPRQDGGERNAGQRRRHQSGAGFPAFAIAGDLSAAGRRLRQHDRPDGQRPALDRGRELLRPAAERDRVRHPRGQSAARPM